MSRIGSLRNLILKAKHAYYYSNEPVMTDLEYDAIEDELRVLAPDDPVLALVGSPVPTDTMLTKARHSIPMGSQSKVNSEVEFRAWYIKNEVKTLHASLKGDGASAAAYYRDGRLVQAISRGDGTLGDDITANALRFKGLPAWVGTQDAGFSGAVRFEVILTVEDWTTIDPSRSKNPRNAGTGIMGRKNGHQADCLTIFAFDLDETAAGASIAFQTEEQKAARLADLGFNVMPYVMCQSADEVVDYFKLIASTRDALPIWIDGVVMKVDDIARQHVLGVTAGRPKGQIAWKFDSSGAESVLEGVVVSGGHTGGLYPTAQLRPVEIGGTTVSNASLANYDEIERLGVAIGDSVWVVKANDIIPKIIRVTQRAPNRQLILTPKVCPFCGGEVGRRQTSVGADGVIVECRNADCPKKSTGKIRRWIASQDILGIGDAVLEAMIERFELEDAGDLYTLRNRASELAQLVVNIDKDLRLGEKRAVSILAEIESTRSQSLSQFLGSLGLDFLGKRRVELMIRSSDGDLSTLESWRSGMLRDTKIAIKAGVPNIGVQIQDGIDAMTQVIDKLIAVGIAVQPESLSAGAELALSKTVCISGKLPSGHKKTNYEAPLRAAGFMLVDEVSKGLNFLVMADAQSTSSKFEKAKKLGIAVLSEEQLIEMVGVAITEVQGNHELNTFTPPKKETHMAYDVFISFKKSGKDGLLTPDAVAARKVYEALKGQNIKTFFSEESLAEEGRGHFGKSIDVALEASRVLILVASCHEHIESKWVEYEWDTFSQDVRSGNKQGELFIYNCGDLKPNKLPVSLRREQMFPEQELEKMIKFVRSAIPSIPTLGNHIHLALHCFHPEKNEDKVYLITKQKGTNADTYNVTAHWGARSSKRLSSQIKAVNVTDEKAKAEIEKARLEKVRGGYAAAAHAKLLTDDARSFLSASLGLTDVPAKKPQVAPTSDVPKKKNAKVKKSPVVSAPVKSAKAEKVAPVSPVKVLKSPKPVVQAKVPVKTVPAAAASSKVVKPSTSAPTKVVKAQKPVAPTKVAPKGKVPVVAKTVCISGKLPSGKKKADYEAPLRAAGYELVDDVVKGLSLLVLADPTVVSSKSEKAKKLGVKIISETQLAKLAR